MNKKYKTNISNTQNRTINSVELIGGCKLGFRSKLKQEEAEEDLSSAFISCGM